MTPILGYPERSKPRYHILAYQSFGSLMLVLEVVSHAGIGSDFLKLNHLSLPCLCIMLTADRTGCVALTSSFLLPLMTFSAFTALPVFFSFISTGFQQDYDISELPLHAESSRRAARQIWLVVFILLYRSSKAGRRLIISTPLQEGPASSCYVPYWARALCSSSLHGCG